ncbi:MAG: GNAT family N-acetyltransferase [Dehalococcoidia bacterium]
MADRDVISLGEIEEDEGPGFTVRAEDFAALAPEWAALHQASGVPGPFQRPEWHATWLRHFGDRAEPVYLAVRDGDRLIGVAALDMAGAEAHQLGDPDVCDYAGPLALPGREHDVALALLDWVAEDMTPRMQLWGLREADPLRMALMEAAAENGWDVAVEDEAVAPVAALPDDWEAFVAGLGKHDRHELRRKLRNLDAAGTVVYVATGDPAEIDAALETLFVFMRASHEGKASFLSPAMEAYFRDVAATFAPLGLLRLGTLSLDGVAVAMLFAFADERGLYLYNSGFDPGRANLAVGLLSKAHAIRDAIDGGKTVFDFLRGDEDYKHRLGGVPAPIYRLTFTRR